MLQQEVLTIPSLPRISILRMRNKLPSVTQLMSTFLKQFMRWFDLGEVCVFEWFTWRLEKSTIIESFINAISEL